MRIPTVNIKIRDEDGNMMSPVLLSNGSIQTAVDEYLDAHPEQRTGVEDASLTEAKFTDELALKTIKDYVTPEMFGAKGDRTTDDTTAIQNAINYASEHSLAVLMPNSYKITSTITISGFTYGKIQVEGDILYTGNQHAILITNMRRSSISFGRITATNGSCIKMYSASNSTDYVSYCSLSFKQLYAGDKCILIEIGQSTGFVNENTIWGGQLVSGNYGIYADAKTSGQIQFKAYNIGFEGVTKGVYLNNAQYCSFINPRYAEMTSNKVIETVGNVMHLLWIGTDKLRVSQLTLSSDTTGVINASICKENGTVVAYRAILNGGFMLPSDGKDRYYNAAGSALDLNVSSYLDDFPTYIIVNSSTVSVKLSKIYGRIYGVNNFICFMSFDNGTTFTIYDADGNVIFNNTANTGYKWCRFEWHYSVGWVMETLDRVALTTS